MRGNSLIENRLSHRLIRQRNPRRNKYLECIKSPYRKLKRVTRWAGIPAKRVTPLSDIYRRSHPPENRPLSSVLETFMGLLGIRFVIQGVWIC
jgi:hypothetical protein